MATIGEEDCPSGGDSSATPAGSISPSEDEIEKELLDRLRVGEPVEMDEVIEAVEVLRSIVREELDKAEAFRRKCRNLEWSDRKEFRKILRDVVVNMDHLAVISSKMILALGKSNAAEATRARKHEASGSQK